MPKYYCTNCNFRTIRENKYCEHMIECKDESKKKINYLFPNRKIYFITYGDKNFKLSKQRLYNKAIHSDFFTHCEKLGPDDLDKEFHTKFKNILNEKQGGGYWIWKPYIIYKKLQKLKENDFLIYLDAGCTINLNGRNRFIEYLNMLEHSPHGILSFETFHKEKYFTNKHLFDYLKIDINSDIANSKQLIGGILIIKKNDNSLNIFSKILEILNKDPYLFTNKYNDINKIKDFKFHRHDQSVLSIIRKKFKTIILKDETYFTNFLLHNSIKFPFFATRIRK
jgi:hypothetical protein